MLPSVSHRHDAVILAAGGIRHLGQPRQLLTIDGETLLARTLRLVAATQPSKTVVVLGAFAERTCSEVTRAVTVFNPDWESGMASSLRLAADALMGRTLPVLVTILGQPALTESHFRQLLDTQDDDRDTVTVYGNTLGVPVVLRARTLARANTLDTGADISGLWRDDTPRQVRADALGEHLDTDDDFRRAIQAGRVDR